MYDQSFPLPSLNKKVIYLDQFVISEMMKALNPATKSHGNHPLHGYWVELFKRLDHLCKLQVLVCPRSEFHADESLLTGQHRLLKRLYELLSGDVAFLTQDEIECMQLGTSAKQWVAGVPEPAATLTRREVIRGGLNAWRERLILSVEWSKTDDLTNDIRESRRGAHEALLQLFEVWQGQELRLPDLFQNEWSSYGPGIIEAYLDHLRRVMDAHSGQLPPNLRDLLGKPAVHKFEYVRDIMARNSSSAEDGLRKTVEFLNSPCIQHVPYVRIASMLFANLAWQAASGRKPPNEGTLTDVNMIATVLPYCDAIFVDKAFASILREDFVKKGLNYQARVFSTTNRDEFLAYLEEIEASIPAEHRALVSEAYGPDWPVPFTSLYTYKVD